VPEQPPVELTLPASNAPPVIGAGGVPATAATSQTVAGLLQPSKGGSGGGTGVGPGAGGDGGTSLFGLGDKGKRFVYVIDRSYSMENYGALRAAKAELIASLERLDEQQEFQVIFYNQSPLALKPRNERFDIFWGTDVQRLDAVGQINAVTSDGATQHMPALLKALELNPDVIFFLTDGDEPPLTKGDLELIKRRNRRARIHCIQFGKGTRLTDAAGKDPGNWLQKLAAQHEGQYTYRDVTRFQARP
jgi:Ca-activated chloride channel family protein